jgi:hypothetical protein
MSHRLCRVLQVASITGARRLFVAAKHGSNVVFCIPHRTKRILLVSAMAVEGCGISSRGQSRQANTKGEAGSLRETHPAPSESHG